MWNELSDRCGGPTELRSIVSQASGRYANAIFVALKTAYLVRLSCC